MSRIGRVYNSKGEELTEEGITKHVCNFVSNLTGIDRSQLHLFIEKYGWERMVKMTSHTHNNILDSYTVEEKS